MKAHVVVLLMAGAVTCAADSSDGIRLLPALCQGKSSFAERQFALLHSRFKSEQFITSSVKQALSGVLDGSRVVLNELETQRHFTSHKAFLEYRQQKGLPSVTYDQYDRMVSASLTTLHRQFDHICNLLNLLFQARNLPRNGVEIRFARDARTMLRSALADLPDEHPHHAMSQAMLTKLKELGGDRNEVLLNQPLND